MGDYSQPVISRYAESASVKIYALTSLMVSENGELVIDGETSYSEGIVTYGGKLVNHGRILLYNLDIKIPEELEIIDKGGDIIIENKPVVTRQGWVSLWL